MTSRWILHTVLVVWILSTIYVVADTDTEEELDASAITGQVSGKFLTERVCKIYVKWEKMLIWEGAGQRIKKYVLKEISITL